MCRDGWREAGSEGRGRGTSKGEGVKQGVRGERRMVQGEKRWHECLLTQAGARSSRLEASYVTTRPDLPPLPLPDPCPAPLDSTLGSPPGPLLLLLLLLLLGEGGPPPDPGLLFILAPKSTSTCHNASKSQAVEGCLRVGGVKRLQSSLESLAVYSLRRLQSKTPETPLQQCKGLADSGHSDQGSKREARGVREVREEAKGLLVPALTVFSASLTPMMTPMSPLYTSFS